MAKVGRRSKYCADVHGKVVEAIRVGATYDGAARYAGISADSLRRWLDAGARGQSPFVGLYKDVQQAEGQAEVHWNAIIERAAREEGQWTAAAWKLERKYPQHYGRRSPEIQVLLQGLSDQELLAVAQQAQIAPPRITEVTPTEGADHAARPND